jgi:hypothetical protein
MSYDPSLSYVKAEDLLVQTAADGNLDVAAAFKADGLGAIVAAGDANVPPPPSPPTAAPPATTTTPAAATLPLPGSSSKKAYPVSVRAVWRRGRIRIELTGRHGRATVDLALHFKRKTKRVVRRIKRHARSVTIPTRRPVSGVVQVRSGHNALSASTPVSV